MIEVKRIESSDQLLYCLVCGEEDAKFRCSQCRVTYYCSRDHQTQDWKVHKKICNERLMKRRSKEYYEKGVIYKNEKNYQKSMKYFNKVIELIPDHFDSLLRRGELYLENYNDSYSAIRDFTQLIMLIPENYIGHYMRANAYYSLWNFHASIDDYSKAISFNPNNDRSFFFRGNSYYMIGNFDNALEDFSRSILLNPHIEQSYINRGNLYLHVGEILLSITDFTEAIKLNAHSHGGYVGRSMAYLKLRRFEIALSDSNESIKLNPSGFRGYLSRAKSLLSLKNYDDAYDDFSKAIELNPVDHNTFISRGDTSLRRKDFVHAIEDYTVAITKKSDDHNGYFKRGVTYQVLGNLKKAIEDYTRTIQLYPHNFRVYNIRGVVYTRSKMFEEALMDFQEANHLNSTNGFPYCHLREIFDEMNYILRRENVFGRFLKNEMDPESPTTNAFLRRFKKLGEFDHPDAIDDYANLVTMLSEDDIHRKMEKIEKVHQHLRMMLTVRRMEWFPFLMDRGRGKDCEDEEVEALRRVLQSKSFDEFKVSEDRRITILRFLPESGRLGLEKCYQCRIPTLPMFVMKFFKYSFINQNSMFQVPYHRNIAPILLQLTNSSVDDIQLVSRYADYNTYMEFSQQRKFFRMEEVEKGSVIFMKYYKKTLLQYFNQRIREDKIPFEGIELCSILHGLLQGVKHLHENKIVHLQIHMGNVFIDEVFGRVILSDFGSGLDLRKNKTGFKVNTKNENKFKFVSDESNEISVKKWGFSQSLAPEISEIDYEKNDLFSVGVIGYQLITGNSYPYGYSPIREQGNFVEMLSFSERNSKEDELENQNSPNEDKELVREKFPGLSNLVKKLLLIDPKERIGHEEALKEISEITRVWDGKTLRKEGVD